MSIITSTDEITHQMKAKDQELISINNAMKEKKRELISLSDRRKKQQSSKKRMRKSADAMNERRAMSDERQSTA